MFVPFRVAGTGAYLPGEPVDNAAIVRLGVNLPPAEWIESTTGIRTRHVAGPDESVASMGAEAARRALGAAGVPIAAIRRIFLTNSQGGDQPLPGTGVFMAAKLGSSAPVLDIASACHGWLLALDSAARFVATGEGPVLVVASELFSRRVLDRADPRTFPIFGDGAAAVVLDRAAGSGGLIAVEHVTHAQHTRAVYIPGPEDPERAAGAFVRFGQDGRTMRDEGEAFLQAVAQRALQSAGMTHTDIDHLVPHQPNAVWLKRICALMGVPMERTPVLVDRTGNLSSAMVPAGLDALWRGPRAPRSGERVLLCSIGAGVGASAMVLRVD